jgi:glycosyltransferase involved in cell wall biosynthesis
VARIVWITDEPPDRRLSGGSIRQSHQLVALAARHRVTLVLAGDAEPDPEVAAAVHRVVRAHQSPAGSPLRRRANRFLSQFTPAGPTDAVAASPRRAAVEKLLSPLLAETDLVIPQHHTMSPLARTGSRPAWVPHPHNVLSVQLRQRAEVTERRNLATRLRLEARWAERRERDLARNGEAVIVVSDEDAAYFRSLGARRLILSPNGFDPTAFPGTPLPAAHRAVFTAMFGYPPNADAARWLAGEIWPAVRRRVPDAKLALVGRQPPSDILGLDGRDGIEVHADVPHVFPHVQAARVALVTIRVGTGSRLKVAEALGAGRPVVGTSVGVEGYGLVDGEHALIADDATALADAIAKVMTDDALGQRIVSAGRSIAEHYTWPAIGKRLAEDLEVLCASSI